MSSLLSIPHGEKDRKDRKEARDAKDKTDWIKGIMNQLETEKDEKTKQSLFVDVLSVSVHFGVWKLYQRYASSRSQPSTEKVKHIYQFVLQQIGTHVESGILWNQYGKFLIANKAPSTEIQELFEEAILIPTRDWDVIWNTYTDWQKSTNAVVAAGWKEEKKEWYSKMMQDSKKRTRSSNQNESWLDRVTYDESFVQNKKIAGLTYRLWLESDPTQVFVWHKYMRWFANCHFPSSMLATVMLEQGTICNDSMLTSKNRRENSWAYRWKENVSFQRDIKEAVLYAWKLCELYQGFAHHKDKLEDVWLYIYSIELEMAHYLDQDHKESADPLQRLQKYIMKIPSKTKELLLLHIQAHQTQPSSLMEILEFCESKLYLHPECYVMAAEYLSCSSHSTIQQDADQLWTHTIRLFPSHSFVVCSYAKYLYLNKKWNLFDALDKEYPHARIRQQEISFQTTNVCKEMESVFSQSWEQFLMDRSFFNASIFSSSNINPKDLSSSAKDSALPRNVENLNHLEKPELAVGYRPETDPRLYRPKRNYPDNNDEDRHKKYRMLDEYYDKQEYEDEETEDSGQVSPIHSEEEPEDKNEETKMPLSSVHRSTVSILKRGQSTDTITAKKKNVQFDASSINRKDLSSSTRSEPLHVRQYLSVSSSNVKRK